MNFLPFPLIRRFRVKAHFFDLGHDAAESQYLSFALHDHLPLAPLQ